MNRLLVTTITRECNIHETSGYLYVVDVDDAVVLSRSPMIEAPLRELDPNPRGGMRGGRGIAVDGDEVYVANFSAVYRFDRAWRCINVITHPACADIHDIAVHDRILWVTSTRNDRLFQFHPDGRLQDYFNVRTMDSVKEFCDLDGLVQHGNLLQSEIDFRDPRSHDPAIYDRTHLNGVAFGPAGELIVSLGQIKSSSGYLSSLVTSGNGFGNPVSVLPDADVPRHNVTIHPDGTLFYNDTPSGEIVEINPLNGSEKRRFNVNKGYLRGLLRLDDGRLVAGAQNTLVIITLDASRPETLIQLTDDYRESVHSIAALSAESSLLPAFVT
jgi:hypothetical protein